MRTAIVTGFDYHVGVFCEKMNAHAQSWKFLAYPSNKAGQWGALFNVFRADALVSFGGPGPDPKLLAAAQMREIPLFVIWAGSDVTRALGKATETRSSDVTGVKHLAIAPWLVDELRDAGINAEYLPLVGMRPVPTPLPLPAEFSALTYLPEPRRDFYGRQHIYKVARSLPLVDFTVIGGGRADPHRPANVRYLGWRSDAEAAIDRSTVLLRVPDHDGMSLLVLEALARGRYVAWRHALPGVKRVATSDETFQYLSGLYVRHAAGQLQPNREGVDFIASAYEERQVALGVEHLLEDTVAAEKQTVAKSRRVAVMGFDVFAADVANLNNRLQTGWHARVLQFGSRYEAISSLYILIKSGALYAIGTPTLNRWARLISDVLKKPRIMHWVGTDIEVARHDRKILSRLQRDDVTHLTEVDWEVEELRELGVEAAIAPLPPRFRTSTEQPLPNVFTILSYLPRSRTRFYGSKELEAVIHAFRGRPIRFLIVGGGTIDNTPPGADVVNLGWCYSLEDIYAQSSVLLRFTPRDGLSLMVLEALAFGRHVIWTKEFPFVRQAVDLKSICQNVQELLALHEAGDLRSQSGAADFVRKRYDRESCVRDIVAAWASAVDSARLPVHERQQILDSEV